MVCWVIPEKLARSSRPGYPYTQVSREIVDGWIADVRKEGIASIICLLGDDQLSYCSGLPPGDLIGYYGQAGFQVGLIRTKDHQHPPLTDDESARIWESYCRLAKPVLIHCSAGIDRSGAAISYIRDQMGGFQART